jgi:hypothetical protein
MNSSLSQNDLLEMVNGDALAIRVPDFYPKSYCQKPAQAIIHNKNFGYYSNPGAGNVGKLGMAYYEVQDNPDSHRKYYEESLEYIRQSRNVFAPYLSPMDKVRLELQEIWRYGANLENLEGKTMNVGLSRVFKEKAQARPHQDVLHWDAPNNLNAYQLATQWATNIYLETAEGGELELWNRKLSKQEYESLRTPGSYEVDRRFLGCPDLTIKPEVGDLIIFDATRVHAVSTIKTGIRVTISCFIGYRGEDQPLSYWS